MPSDGEIKNKKQKGVEISYFAPQLNYQFLLGNKMHAF